MEKNNRKLMIIVGSLLLVISISFSYFLATTLINGNGASTKITTARINGATLNVEGTLGFDDTGILPGHKNVSAVKVTALGNNQLIAYNLIWQGETGISQINYTVYKSSTPKTISTNCSDKTSVVNGMHVLSEECSISNINTLGESIASGSIRKGDTKVTLALDEFITATTDGDIKYYYVVLEYPNLDIDQSSDIEATFEGEVTVEESNKEADINILAVYVADDLGNYTETADIPQDGYVLSEKSTCSNNASVRMEAGELITSNLTKSGTSCYLYFNKLKTVNTVLGNIQVNPEVKTKFDKAATTDEGIQQAPDGMYGGTSYYWRGAATTNYLKFAGYCWRIVRINGDGTIRLIYDGTTCHANGSGFNESLAISNVKYSLAGNKAEYAGWTYTEGLQRPINNDEGISSNAKLSLDNWYNNNLKIYEDKIADGKYCNDREVVVNSVWSSVPIVNLYYNGYNRLYKNKSPMLSCNEKDIYTLKIGILMADEVSFAGNIAGESKISYLCNGKTFWLMTPSNIGPSASLRMFVLYESGELGWNWIAANSEPGIRPVINLRSDVIISSGNGTRANPYLIAD